MKPSDVIAALSWSQRQQIEAFLSESIEQIAYPWDEIASKPFMMLGYGSLLNPLSAAKTIANTPTQGHPPVVAFGLLRIFNYRKWHWQNPETQPPKRVFERGVAQLNCEADRRLNAAVGARAIEITPISFQALVDREAGYDFVKVPYLDWPLVAGGDLKYAYVLMAPKLEDADCFVADDLLPDPSYTQLCCEGAHQVDAAFGELFEQSTYLGDRKTTLRQYLGA